MVETELCIQCEARPVDRDGLCFGCRMGSIKFTGLHRLRKENDGGYTQREIGREIFDAARRDGREIQRAGRSYT